MPNVQIEDQDKNTIKLTFTITLEEAQPYLDEAVERLAKTTSIPGFRPGNAGYEVVKNRFGEMKIYEEALEPLVRKSYIEAVLAHNIETVGSPKIDVVKLAPENDIVFTAEIARMPRTTSLADIETLKVEKKKPVVEDKDIDLALNDLQRMQTKEVRAPKDTIVTDKEKIVVSMNIKKDNVPVEGGQSPNHIIYLNENYYIPGLKDKVKGMKEGEEKTFKLSFPEEHVQKLLAGNEVEFEITLKEIFNLEIPEVNDEFAKALGMKDVKTLRETIKTNMLEEKKQEESFRQEKEMLELIAKKSQFEDIPDLLLNEEINKMIGELKQGVEEQGLEFDTYLKNLKKTLADLKIDFTPQALMRIKVAIVMRAIADDQDISIDEKELEEELDRTAEQYKEEDQRKQIYSPQYREYAEHVLKNRKVIDFLRDKIVE